MSLMLLSNNSEAQKKHYELTGVGFYNLENLFDTDNDPKIRDDEYTPEGKNKWTKDKYAEKLFNMAHVISLISKEETNDNGVSVLGVCEVENRKVLEDLVQQPALKARNLQIAHIDSPDKRGIDVGLLYNPKDFKMLNTKSYIFEHIFADGDTLFTRNQLLVTGLLKGERYHFIVNHWPSRRGGEKRSRPLRNAAADVTRSIADSIFASEPNAKVVIMGDLNDDPRNQSVRKHIKTKPKKKSMKEGLFYNPWEIMLKKGVGTLAYGDSWNLFDQILLSNAMVSDDTNGSVFYKAKVFKHKFMVQQDGRFKGYPKRTYSYGNYNGGYSDHFPTYILLVKNK